MWTKKVDFHRFKKIWKKNPMIFRKKSGKFEKKIILFFVFFRFLSYFCFTQRIFRPTTNAQRLPPPFASPLQPTSPPRRSIKTFFFFVVVTPTSTHSSPSRSANVSPTNRKPTFVHLPTLKSTNRRSRLLLYQPGRSKFKLPFFGRYGRRIQFNC